MNPKRDTEFRLKLAAGFFREAEEDIGLSRKARDTAKRIIEQWPQKRKK